ncbi:MAG: Bifunctional NMN adenylyltransferase/Nudix hydrolase [Deltaproteobacteria bacterium ADurb.BinA179]|nr:MAG: Bifunctional NMN adenylyltransferase/Nudix hydrolase [Deltaproteobacteria bacterium ADurb.BinA179]
MAVKEMLICPSCGHVIERYKNPVPTVDIIIEYAAGIVLVERKNPPYGWALPGGFVDYGETVEQAARREAGEETGLAIDDLRMFHVYSDPERDPRHHTITTVFVARGSGSLRAGDDAGGAGVFTQDALPEPIAFDHGRIISDYFSWKRGERRGMPCR